MPNGLCTLLEVFSEVITFFGATKTLLCLEHKNTIVIIVYGHNKTPSSTSLMNDHIMFSVLINTAQVCRNGMVQHLEHLLFYGANMNARNASGNTPLHVCAVNNQVFNQLSFC